MEEEVGDHASKGVGKKQGERGPVDEGGSVIVGGVVWTIHYSGTSWN